MQVFTTLIKTGENDAERIARREGNVDVLFCNGTREFPRVVVVVGDEVPVGVTTSIYAWGGRAESTFDNIWQFFSHGDDMMNRNGVMTRAVIMTRMASRLKGAVCG